MGEALILELVAYIAGVSMPAAASSPCLWPPAALRGWSGPLSHVPPGGWGFPVGVRLPRPRFHSCPAGRGAKSSLLKALV